MKDWLIGNAYPLQEGKANESNKTSGFSLVIKFFIVNVQSIVIAL